MDQVSRLPRLRRSHASVADRRGRSKVARTQRFGTAVQATRLLLGRRATAVCRKWYLGRIQHPFYYDGRCSARVAAPMPIVDVPVSKITDWSSFHDVFAETLGFPGFYCRNMDAWIDCLTYRDEDDGMASVVVPPGDVLTLQLDAGRDFAARCPDQDAALIESAALVNRRRIGGGERPILTLSFS
jgi:hypothetical protein